MFSDMCIRTWIFLSVVLFFSCVANSSLSARTFKTLTGVPIDASFIKLESSGSQQIAVFKMDRTGREYKIPLARLSKHDQMFVKSQGKKSIADSNNNVMPTKIPGSALVPPQSSAQFAFANMMSKLVSLQGSSIKPYKVTESPEYFAFYFAAGWCAPCKRFTPMLAEYYKNNIAYANPKFEIIFVSRDNSDSDMTSYMKEMKMPWPAVSYGNSNRKKLIQKYAPSGTPSLVLVDRAGKVISESFVDGKPRGAFAVKQDIAVWFTDGERTATGRTKSSLTHDKRVSD